MDVTPILSNAGLTIQEVDDPAVRLDAQAQLRFLDLAAEALDDDLLGFHLARGFDLREIGLFYYIMASADRLADALHDAERFSAIVNEGVQLRSSFGQSEVVNLEYVGIERRFDRHHVEFWLVALLRICRKITDSRLTPTRLRFRHHRSDARAEFKSFFGVDVEFGADADEIVLSRPVASLPNAGRDPYLNRLLSRYAEEALARRPKRRASVRSAVERTLPELLPHGRATLPEVARRLGMGRRTLSRKLRDEKVAFAEILDKLRAALARRYLGERELPVTEVAWLLGYREVSSLTHAFRRWTGMTPRQFRESGGRAAGRRAHSRRMAGE